MLLSNSQYITPAGLRDELLAKEMQKPTIQALPEWAHPKAADWALTTQELINNTYRMTSENHDPTESEFGHSFMIRQICNFDETFRRKEIAESGEKQNYSELIKITLALMAIGLTPLYGLTRTAWITPSTLIANKIQPLENPLKNEVFETIQSIMSKNLNAMDKAFNKYFKEMPFHFLRTYIYFEIFKMEENPKRPLLSWSISTVPKSAQMRQNAATLRDIMKTLDDLYDGTNDEFLYQTLAKSVNGELIEEKDRPLGAFFPIDSLNRIKHYLHRFDLVREQNEHYGQSSIAENLKAPSSRVLPPSLTALPPPSPTTEPELSSTNFSLTV